MQSEEKQTTTKKQKRRHPKSAVRTGILAACIAVLAAGGALAMYVTSNQKRAEMESAHFHISSNYLEEESANAQYNVVDWGNGFDILLYNYEKENIAQVSQVEMAYTVAAPNATVTVSTEQGTAPSESPDENGSYLFAGNTGAYHVLHVLPDNTVKAGEKVTVTVTTTSPYKKTLSAKFSITNNSRPDYRIEEQPDGTVMVTIQTNDYENDISVTWDPEKYSPDNTNDLMASWEDVNPTRIFRVEKNATYELLFFKKGADGPTGEPSGTGTEISLK